MAGAVVDVLQPGLGLLAPLEHISGGFVAWGILDVVEDR